MRNFLMVLIALSFSMAGIATAGPEIYGNLVIKKTQVTIDVDKICDNSFQEKKSSDSTIYSCYVDPSPSLELGVMDKVRMILDKTGTDGYWRWNNNSGLSVSQNYGSRGLFVFEVFGLPSGETKEAIITLIKQAFKEKQMGTTIDVFTEVVVPTK